MAIALGILEQGATLTEVARLRRLPRKSGLA
jgi:hypothetical protein